MKATTVYIGFFTYARYDKLIIESSEEACWKAMKKEYYEWKKANDAEYRTWKEALEYFGWIVREATTGTQIEY